MVFHSWRHFHTCPPAYLLKCDALTYIRHTPHGKQFSSLTSVQFAQLEERKGEVAIDYLAARAIYDRLLLVVIIIEIRAAVAFTTIAQNTFHSILGVKVATAITLGIACANPMFASPWLVCC